MALVVVCSRQMGLYDDIPQNYFSMNYADELVHSRCREVQEFGSDFGMRIWLDPAKMAQNKVTASEVISAVKDTEQTGSGR